ncbi:MAG: hypothetical protein GTO18_13880 [Anaerolineales bacterium]|nr:hypothetical protein [Anaerolineales bacterium]
MKRFNRPMRNWAVLLILIAIGISLVSCDLITNLTNPGTEANVSHVETERRPRDPPEYYAIAFGQHSDACTSIGRIDQKVRSRTIVVTMYTTRPQDAVCAQVVTPFEETVLLGVDGLSAGSYSVEVNGVVASLTILEDH